MKKKKVMVSLGNEELKKRLSLIPEIEIIEEDDDIDILTDILDMVKADAVILNTVLSYEKGLNLAAKAKKLKIKVIALTGDKKGLKSEIGALAALGVNVFLDFDEIYMIPSMIENYPREFDFTSLGSGKNSGKTSIEAASIKVKKSVAFLGVMDRIGVTTQAVSLLSYLSSLGHKGVYVEKNPSGYIKSLFENYKGTSEKEDGIISYLGMDFLPGEKLDNIRSILDSDYTYYIYDYGNIESSDLTWIEKDYIILTCGTKPNELKAFSKSIKKVVPYSPKFVFSFTSEDEREDVLREMGGYKKDTYFAEYNPDPFSDKNSGKIYGGVVGLLPKKG